MAIKVTVDGLSPATRHALISAAAAGLAWALPFAEANYTNWNLPPAVLGVAGAALPWLTMWSTRLSVQYGVGAPEKPVTP